MGESRMAGMAGNRNGRFRAAIAKSGRLFTWWAGELACRRVVGSGHSLLGETPVNEQGENGAIAHFPPPIIHKGRAIDQRIKLFGTASLELCRVDDR